MTKQLQKVISFSQRLLLKSESLSAVFSEAGSEPSTAHFKKMNLHVFRKKKLS